MHIKFLIFTRLNLFDNRLLDHERVEFLGYNQSSLSASYHAYFHSINCLRVFIYLLS